MTATVVSPREARRPEFPATVHAYTDVLRELIEGPHSAEALAQATGRVASNVRRDLPRLRDVGVVEPAGKAAAGGVTAPRWALTDKGRRWVTGIDVAEGKATIGGELTALLVQLIPDPDQPRQAFDEDELAGLADSIADKGLLQPILVRPAGPNGLHMIVAGERRYRALGILARDGLWPGDKAVPIRIATPQDEAEAMELALVENTQRADLNHMELALGYQRLADLGRTPKQIAAVVGRTNDHVTQHLRLTRLSPDDQAAVAAGELPLHHALDRLREGGAKAGGGGDEAKPAEAAVQWTVHDIHRTPFAVEAGSTDPILTLWIMHDGHQGYRVDWRGDFGDGQIDHTGGEVLANVSLALSRSIDGIRSRRTLDRPLSEWLDPLQGPHVVNGVDYFNAARAQEARFTLGWDERKANHGAGHAAPGSTPTLADLTDDAAQEIQIASPDLSPRARLALVELAHKVAVERRPLVPADAPDWTGDREGDHAAFGASVGQFWLDGAHGELTAARLVGFTHVRGGLPPLASLTTAGVAFLIDAAIDLPVDDRALERAQMASGLGINLGVTYETPWLEQVAQPHLPDADASGDPDTAESHDDPWGRTPDQITEDEHLDAQVAQLVLGDPLVDVANLFADFGVAAAETRERSDDDIGIVFLLNAEGQTVTTLTVDQPGELPPSRARALADLAAHQLNAVLG